MMGYFEEKGYHTLWEIMIDEKFQNKGYGKQAVLLGIEFLKNKFGVKEIYLSVDCDNAAARHLYESVGFQPASIIENDVTEMRLYIR